MKARLHALRNIGPVALGLALLVGCGDDNPTSPEPTEVPTYSFAAIQGDWEGASDTTRHRFFWIDISITEESAKRGATMGTLAELGEEGGDALCLASLLASRPEPPRYFAEFRKSFVAEGWACDGTARLEYDETAETLTYSWKGPNSSNFVVQGVLSRAN